MPWVTTANNEFRPEGPGESFVDRRQKSGIIPSWNPQGEFATEILMGQSLAKVYIHLIFSTKHRERILFARDYLLKNIDYPPTLTELANIAGINVFKLKRGFKETFGQTVFEYLAETRLELAKNDLLHTEKSVTEIAFELGYSSLQHFSGAFKKRFGVAPGGVRGGVMPTTVQSGKLLL